jgi:hypothetical protein
MDSNRASFRHVSNQQSAITNHQSPINNQQSTINNQQSTINNQQFHLIDDCRVMIGDF